MRPGAREPGSPSGLIDVTRVPVCSWSGGSMPHPLDRIDLTEALLAWRLFLEQSRYWLKYWTDTPLPCDFAIFWNRARYDAHSTYRHVGPHSIARPLGQNLA